MLSYQVPFFQTNSPIKVLIMLALFLHNNWQFVFHYDWPIIHCCSKRQFHSSVGQWLEYLDIRGLKFDSPGKVLFKTLMVVFSCVFVPTFDTKVTEYLCSGWVFFSSDTFRLLN